MAYQNYFVTGMNIFEKLKDIMTLEKMDIIKEPSQGFKLLVWFQHFIGHLFLECLKGAAYLLKPQDISC